MKSALKFLVVATVSTGVNAFETSRHFKDHQKRYFFQSNRASLINYFKTTNYPLLLKAKSRNIEHHEEHPTNRRKFIRQKIVAIASITTLQTISPTLSNAACLSGDTSQTCIGVYKLPLDDAVRSYIETPEALSKFAPDLKWVPPVEYPKNARDAIVELKELQIRVGYLKNLITQGELVTAGTEILGVVPRITVSGRVVIGALRNGGSDLSMKAYRSEVSHAELLAKLGSCDIMIGQAIDGQLGSLTVAQIQILEELKEVDSDFSDFMKAIPEGFKG